MSIMLLILLPIRAQLTVKKSGQSIFGQHMRVSPNVPIPDPFLSHSQNSVSIPWTYVTLDSIATTVFLGKEKNNGGAYVTFGGGKHVWVGELSPQTSTWDCILQLGGMNGIRATGRTGTIFNFLSSPSSTSDFRFYTNVRANSFIVDSDSRIKSNVTSLENTSGLLLELSPISYTLTSQTAAGNLYKKDSEIYSADLTDTPSIPSDRVRYGFIAQEVQQLFPELVVEDIDGTLGIDYIGFIPVLVNAIKDLKIQIADQEKEIAALSGNYMRIPKTNDVASNLNLQNNILGIEQNIPNPFSSGTSINCSIPESIGNADIFVYDLQGGQKLHVPVTERGYFTLTIDGTHLSPGMYIYVLIADGQEIDSKRMIVTD